MTTYQSYYSVTRPGQFAGTAKKITLPVLDKRLKIIMIRDARGEKYVTYMWGDITKNYPLEDIFEPDFEKYQQDILSKEIAAE